MKKIPYLIAIIFTTFSLISAQTDSTVVEVFSENVIKFGNGMNTEPVIEEDNGRIISRNIELPVFEEPVQITAYLDVIAYGDPWDRAGSIYLTAENMDDVEILKFITSYGRSYSHKLDVTDLAPLLMGKSEINAMIDTWSGGWKVNLKLVYKKVSDIEQAVWTEGIFNDQSLEADEVDEENPTKTVNIPAGIDKVQLTYYCSGHCTDGRGADEFVPKTHKIFVDDELVYDYVPWRDDCEKFPSDGNYWLSRSGWCPGDKVYPVKLDLSEQLSPGEHEIRFWVEDIRPRGSDGHLGYWRVSSFLTEWMGDEEISASRIEVTAPQYENLIPTDFAVPIRVDLLNNQGLLAINESAELEIKSSNNNVLFSTDKENWSNPLDYSMLKGSGQFWVKAKEQIDFEIEVEDKSGSLNSPDNIEMSIYKNIAGSATANAPDACNWESEKPAFAIDGDNSTKWCDNNGNPPHYIDFKLDQKYGLNYFIIRHAGAGGEAYHMNTDTYEIQFHDGIDWVTCASLDENMDDETGNVTSHYLNEAINTDSLRLYIINPEVGGGTVARIYEVEMYNVPFDPTTGVSEISNGVIQEFKIYPNYPNPFNPDTKVKFFVPEYSKVSVNVYNSLGQLVKVVMNGELTKGHHFISWDAKNMHNKNVAAGTYYLNLKYKTSKGKMGSLTQKMIYLP